MEEDMDIPRKLMSGKAVASLIIGVVAIVLVIIPFAGLLVGIIGLFLGIRGLHDIKHFQQKGKNIAIAGIVCNGLGMLLPIILIIIGYIIYVNGGSSIVPSTVQ